MDFHRPAPPAPSCAPFDAKFSFRRPHAGIVSRVDLIETARTNGCRFVAVTAPAGYGKSTLLAEWASMEDRPVAWVSLDHFDDDPATLLGSLASAYCRIGLDRTALIADMRRHGASAARQLASAFGTSSRPFVLMLDDLHELRSPACHDVLALVTSAIPRGSQLVAASRSEQPHLPRLRAAGDALEFGADDLALDAAGARRVLSHEQISATPEQAAALVERTEGWPVGLYLAALIAKQSDGRLQTITGADRYVADYLYRETLTQQPKAVQRFLRRTSVLDQLCAPLCGAVLGSSAAAIHLRHLESRSLFLAPLDREREWYRYHDLFREFLLGELRRTEPDIIATLHQRAADWYEANGSPAQAVEHLLRTNDSHRTTRLVTKLTVPTYMAGKTSTVLRWYRSIGDAKIERHPPLAVHRCWVSMLTGDTTGALRWAAVVDDASFDLVPADGSASFDSARAMLRAGMCATGPESMLANANFAVSEEPAWSPYRDTALWLLAEAHLLAGHRDEGRAAFAEASAVAAGVGNSDNAAYCDAQLAWLAMDCGRWQEAAARLESALCTIEENRTHDYVFSIPVFAGAARLSLSRGEVKQARRRLLQAMRVRPSATYLLPYHAVRLRLQLAKVYLTMTEMATVRQLLREIDDILKHRPALGALVDEVGDFRAVLAVDTNSRRAPAALPLTPAEIRLLPYLQTHLTAGMIAEQLFLSSHTVKTEIKSVYRKLGVSSRNDAVQKATSIGLLGTT